MPALALLFADARACAQAAPAAVVEPSPGALRSTGPELALLDASDHGGSGQDAGALFRRGDRGQG